MSQVTVCVSLFMSMYNIPYMRETYTYPPSLFCFSLPAQEFVHFMAQLLRLVDIKDAAIVGVWKQHHRYKGCHIDGLLVGAHLCYFLLEPCLHRHSLFSFELATQTALFPVALFFFFLYQMG